MNFDFTKSMIWQGVNRNFLKLQGAKFFMKLLKPKNIQITRTESKKIFYRGKTENDLYYRGVKHY